MVFGAMAKQKPKPDDARRTRGAASRVHPYVSVVPYDPKAGAWRVRCPELGIDRWFRRASGADWTGVQAFAVRQSVEAIKAVSKREHLRTQAELHGTPPPADARDGRRRRTLSAMCAEYIAVKIESKQRSDSYPDSVHRYLNLWIGWCWARGIKYVDELVDRDHPPANLTRYRTWWITEHRQQNGKRYASSTMDLAIKLVSAALGYECGAYTIPGLDSAMVKQALELEHDDAENACEPIRTPGGIRDLITAARAYDRRVHTSTAYRNRPHHAPRAVRDVINLLLGGFRAHEYTELRRSGVDLDAYHPGGELDVTVIGKGRRDRKVEKRTRQVYYRDFSPLGAEFLVECLCGQPKNGWLSEHTYGAINSMLGVLHAKHGAPDVSAHDLRATCATYTVAVAGLNSDVRAMRLGHGQEEHARTYVKQIKGLVMNSPSIEAAMQIEDLVREVLAEMRAEPRRPRRTDSRARKRVFAARALNAKNRDRALAEVFAAPPKPRAKPIRSTRPPTPNREETAA